MTSVRAPRPSREVIPPLGGVFAANFLLAWRAVTRNRPVRLAAVTITVIGALAPALASAFFFFVAEHTRIEMLASNIFLWSAGYALLLLPAAARPVSCRGTGVFGALTPISATGAVLGRFAGLFAAYLGVAAVLVVLAVIGASLISDGPVGPLLTACLPQLALGSILVAGVFLFSQAGGALFTGACGVLWFVLATQKGGVLASCDAGIPRSALSVALAWLPDFGLLRVSPDLIRPTDLASVAAYAMLFAGFYLLLAVLVVRTSWRRLGRRVY